MSVLDQTPVGVVGPSAELLARFKLTAEEWNQHPATLRERMQARFAAEQAKVEAKRKAEVEKEVRRWKRGVEWREKQPDMVALCGLYYYSCSPRDRARGSYWRSCVKCGKPLIYYATYEEAMVGKRDCKRD